MEVIRTIKELQRLLKEKRNAGQTIGFVPTMGYLHEGHLALVHNARAQNDIVVMSIFVNPAQFGPGEDFEAYPRNEKGDIESAEEAGVDFLFMPNSAEMYPHEEERIRILPGIQASALCGASRPGHFDGVLKVVLKLFNIVNPDKSYFGLKDAQQLAIIETFVHDFNINTKIVRVPTVREEDGLAKSSRNVNLSAKERRVAPVIYEALQKGTMLFRDGLPAAEVEEKVKEHITGNSSGVIDYVSLLSYPTLAPFEGSTSEAILACAVKFEKTRLIDNILLSTGDETNV